MQGKFEKNRFQKFCDDNKKEEQIESESYQIARH